ncbi:MAG: oxidoreductase domain protein [Oscillospiraceae bacterium]|nr:oxidoreductase domain protein [Oscillospiraceae bacterium]
MLRGKIIMKKLKIGIVGIGNMGSAHAVSIFSGNIPEMELAAVCDTDDKKRLWAKEKLGGAAVFDDYEKLLNSGLIDALIIATPHYFHPEIAIKAFESGVHVLTEKPAGVSVKQVERMNEAANRSGKIFGIMFNQRTSPIYQRAREIVQSGRLGKPKRLVWIITNWYRKQSYYDSGGWRATWKGEGGGVLMNQAPHNLDLWQWIFGMPKRVRGFCSYGKHHNIEVEDDATIYAEYESGATADFITSTGELPGTNRLEISGDRGKIVIEEGKLRLWELSVPERDFCFESDKDCTDPSVTYTEYTPKEPENAHDIILKNFAESILLDKSLLAPGIEGINQLQICNAAYLSDWTNDWVELPVDEDAFEERLMHRVSNSELKGAVSQAEDVKGQHSNRWKINW